MEIQDIWFHLHVGEATVDDDGNQHYKDYVVPEIYQLSLTSKRTDIKGLSSELHRLLDNAIKDVNRSLKDIERDNIPILDNPDA